MARWVIRLEAEDGLTQLLGTWAGSETPDHLADKLRRASSRYGGPGPDVAVTVELVERWPGMSKLLAEWGLTRQDIEG